MLCALDQVRLEHCSPPSLSSCSPSFSLSSRLFEVFTMKPSSSSPPEQGSVGYFHSMASGRQRTAQACDKCRERKTKVRQFFPPLIHTQIYLCGCVWVCMCLFLLKNLFFSVLVTSPFVSDVLIEVSYANTLIERLAHVDQLGCE